MFRRACSAAEAHVRTHFLSWSLIGSSTQLFLIEKNSKPGYYEDGNFGIRLDNVLIVKEAPTEHNFADKGYLAFEHITWVPFQKKMINLSLLSDSEKKWVDDYHLDCRKHLSPLLSGSDLEWLEKATEPLVY